MFYKFAYNLGTSWKRIEMPTKCPSDFRFIHVSVGMGAVWALGNNDQVFFKLRHYIVVKTSFDNFVE